MRALLLTQTPDGPHAGVTDVDPSGLPPGDVTIDVACSSLNYKDGLAVTGRGKIVRGAYPFVPGIDLAGTVQASDHADFAPGDAVVLTGWGTGEDRWGGYAEQARASGDHLVKLPDGLTPHDAMAIGTAGFTAMLSVMALEHAGLSPDRAGEVVVTGASGGVGSVAVALLARAGFRVAASTGSASAHAYLKGLGASRIVDRSELEAETAPLARGEWAGAVDTVGGSTLAHVLATARWHAPVAACGLAGGASLKTTVFPFILRGVMLLGIDSNTAPAEQRQRAWARLADAVADGLLERVRVETIGLDDVIARSEAILAGQTQGRVVVALR